MQSIDSGSPSSIVGLSFREDALHLVAVDQSGRVNLWDLSGSTPVARLLTGLGGNPIGIGFDSKGQTLVVTLAGGAAYILDPVHTDPIQLRGPFNGWLYEAAVAPDDKSAATTGADDTVRQWKLDGTPLGAPIRSGQDQVMDVDYSPDGSRVASAGADGTAKVWTTDGALVGQLVGHGRKVLAIRYAPNGNLIATAGIDGTVRLWRPSGEQVAQFSGRYGALATEALGGDFGSAGLAFNTTSQSIAIADNTGAVRVWRIQRLDELLQNACEWLRVYRDTHADAPRNCDS